MAEKYDLVIVGTGFASSFFLKKFLDHPSAENKKVLILERGKFHSLAERLQKKTGKINLNITRPFETYKTHSSKPWVFDPNFGGSSNCWTGCTPRFMPNDFRINSLYGVGTDWPVSYEELDPYYSEAEEIMAISGPDTTPFPKRTAYPLPPHSLSTVDRLLHERYGDLYISQPTARASRAVNGRGNCCSSAVCNLCPVNAKFTIENGLIDIYKDPRVTISYESQVIKLDIKNNIAEGVFYLHGEREEKAFGETIILGANAIFNAHILLNSGDNNPLTGSGISEQTGILAHFYYDGLENVGGGSIISANGFMMYDGDFRKTRPSCLIESFNMPIIRNERGKWRQLSLFKFIFEDLPSAENKVVLSSDILKPRIQYSGHSDYVKKGLKDLPSQIDKYFSFLPIEHYELDNSPQPTEYHICSTVRMGKTREDGSVDRNLVHHDYRNVLVLGSSAFPTVTAANPTLTLSALSLHAANHFLS
jgi:choline dehydrogenase-like flavoprotein